MLHTPLFRRSVSPPFLAGGLPRLLPSEYLSLRRRAAGISLDEAAMRLAENAHDLADAKALIRMLETRGVAARSRAVIEHLQAAFPIDPDVYHQLATEPADRHPQICGGCGCSQNDACVDAQHGHCGWAEPGMCTRCADGDWL